MNSLGFPQSSLLPLLPSFAAPGLPTLFGNWPEFQMPSASLTDTFDFGSLFGGSPFLGFLKMATQIKQLEQAANNKPSNAFDSQALLPGLTNGGANTNTGRLKIAVIDSFVTQSNGFNHGEEISRILKSGGSDASLAGKIDLLQFDVNRGSNRTDGIADALEDVIRRVQNGEKIDAVNISQQDFTADADTQRVQEAINRLKELNVPVAVAAGNEGAGAVNQLANNNAFVVSSTTNGLLNSSSGLGNIRAEGRSTSFATANAAPILAKLKASGLSVDRIKARSV